MTNIAGQIAFDGGPIPCHIEPTPDRGGILPHASLSGPMTYTNVRGAIVAIKGDIDFDGSADAASVAQSVLEAYLAKGAAIVSELRGPFALVIFEPNARKCLIAIDRMGIERLAWGQSKGWIAVGSSASDVARDLAAATELNHQALFNFMYSHMVPAPHTVFQGVSKLPPGTAIEFSENGRREFRYWQPDFEREIDVDINQLLEDTRPLLRKAIERTHPGEIPALS